MNTMWLFNAFEHFYYTRKQQCRALFRTATEKDVNITKCRLGNYIEAFYILTGRCVLSIHFELASVRLHLACVALIRFLQLSSLVSSCSSRKLHGCLVLLHMLIVYCESTDYRHHHLYILRELAVISLWNGLEQQYSDDAKRFQNNFGNYCFYLWELDATVSGFDCCNFLLYFASSLSIKQIQRVQNLIVHVVCKRRKSDRIMHLLFNRSTGHQSDL